MVNYSVIWVQGKYASYLNEQVLALKTNCLYLCWHIGQCGKSNATVTKPLWKHYVHKTNSCVYFEPRHEKTCFAIYEQQRLRSACASAQSDQRLCCSLPR